MLTHNNGVRRIVTYGLLFFALTLPISKSASNVLVIGIATLTLYLVMSSPSYRNFFLHQWKQPLIIPMLLFVAIAVVGLFFNDHVVAQLGSATKFYFIPLIYLAVSLTIQSQDDPVNSHTIAERALLLFLIGVGLLNGIGLLTYIGMIGNKAFMLPLAPLNVHHIWFANVNAVGLYGAVSFLLFSNRHRKGMLSAIWGVFIIVSLASILLSTSRTAWLGILLTTVVLLFAAGINKKILYAALTSLAISCALLYQFNSIIHERINLIATDLTQFVSGATTTSVGERLMMWKAAFKMFLAYPVFGVGTGDYGNVLREFIAAGEMPDSLSRYNQPHNTFLFTLASNGIVGLSALLYLFFTIIKKSYSLLQGDGPDRLFGFLALAVAIHYLIAGQFDSFFNISILRHSFAFIMGICIRTLLTKSVQTSQL